MEGIEQTLSVKEFLLLQCRVGFLVNKKRQETYEKTKGWLDGIW